MAGLPLSRQDCLSLARQNVILNTVVHGYCGCSCRCYAAALELLLCTCPDCCAVLLQLLLFLLCLRYVFAADPREHGYHASHPLSVMCLRILKLKTDSSASEAVRILSRN